jgi:sodium/potassium-transporting ATPase subunit alpha
MITGDHPITAKSIAKQVGIITGDTREDIAKKKGIHFDKVDSSEVNAIVITGSQLNELTDEELGDILENHEQIVFART